MSIFDRFRIRKTGPRKTNQPLYMTPARRRDPQRPGMVRGFDAAKGDDLMAGWFSPSVPIDELLRAQLRVLKARSRERFRNDDYAVGVRRAMISNVVGPRGIRLQARAKDPDGTRDEVACRAIEKAWAKWCRKGADAEGRLSMLEIQRLLVSADVTDGEVIIQHIAGKDGYSVRVIDSELLDPTYCVKLDNGRRIHMGVEEDAMRRPIAYHFLAQESPLSYQAISGKKYIRVPAEQITHKFPVHFVGQSRGIPPLAVAMARLKMLSGWEDASLVKARIGSSTMGFYTQEDQDTAAPVTMRRDDGVLVEEVEPGMFKRLPPGVGFKEFDPDFPNGEFAPFKKAMLQAIAGGVGIDYPTLAQDPESVNFSTMRSFLLETRSIYMGVQEWFIDSFMQEIFERWLLHSLLAESIRFPSGKPLPFAKLEKFSEVSWRPRRWSWVDPLKDAQAAMLLVKGRIRAPSSIAEDMGVDYEDELERMARDEELMRQHGLTYLDDAALAKATAQSEKEKAQNED